MGTAIGSTFERTALVVPLLTLIGCGLYLLACAASAVRIRIRRGRGDLGRRTFPLSRLLPLVTLALAAGPRSDGARGLRVAPPRIAPDLAPPWTESDGWSPPSDSVPPPTTSEGPAKSRSARPVHPAIHPRQGSSLRDPDPLFARTGRTSEGKRGPENQHTVRPDDTLWDIAERELATDDPLAIHHYWHRIFDANRSVLGADPDLIHAGTIIELPPHTS